MEFTGCRKYVGEAAIAFEETPKQPPVIEKQLTEIELPAGLFF